MIFKYIGKYKTRNRTMPIHTCCAIPDVYDAVWTYVPGERINFANFITIRSLVIECWKPTTQDPPPTQRRPWCLLGDPRKPYGQLCSGHSNNFFQCLSAEVIPDEGPYTLPSLYQFPFLEKVTIANLGDHRNTANVGLPESVYLKAITDLPPGVRVLGIHRSKIQDIGAIIASCPNLVELRLQNNAFPINIRHFPDTLQKINVIGETFIHDIRITPNLRLMSLLTSKIPAIQIDDDSDIGPHLGRHDRLMIAGCDSPYNEHIMANNLVKFHVKAAHILYINALRVYRHFGSIPTRIHNVKEEYETNPIVTVMCLASNYPRRMAEFIAHI